MDKGRKNLWRPVVALGLALGLVLAARSTYGDEPRDPAIFFPITWKAWPPCYEHIRNGGFEVNPPAAPPWVQSSSHAFYLVRREAAYSGSWGAFLGGILNASQEELYQTVSIPPGALYVSLSYFWKRIPQRETNAAWNHHLYVSITDQAGSVLLTLEDIGSGSAAESWQRSTFNLAQFMGRTIRLSFQATSGQGDYTAFFVDEVSLIVCGGSFPPSPE